MAGHPRRLDAADLDHLVRVALGRAPADTVIRGARLVNVFTETVEEPGAVALSRGRVASLGPELPGWLGPDTQVVAAEGRFLLPGLIDAHTHLDSIFGLSDYAALVLARGDTAAVTETSMIAGAWGARGVDLILAEAAAAPMRLFGLAPPLVPPFPELETSAGYDADSFAACLARPEVLGVGETYWPAVTDGQGRALSQLAAAAAAGKSREGHAAGARGERLTAYAAAGITSCHEATTAAEALERLRLGLAVQVREGFVRREMDAVVPALANLPDTRGVMLVSDLAPLEQIVEAGSLAPLLAKAVALGVPPARAAAWCSLNPARYFGLNHLGAVAPGYAADLWLAEDLVDFRAAAVWLEGRQVAAGGRFLGRAPAFAWPEEARRTMLCPRLDPTDFRVPAAGGRAAVRVIEAAGDTITREAVDEAAVDNGDARPDPARDLLKIAHINRHSTEKKLAVGFCRGFGLRRGALATNLIWDTSNLMVVGASEAEMALAANRVIDMGGGLCVVEGDTVLAELPLSVAGVISPLPMAEVVARSEACEAAAKGLGSSLARPFLTAQTFCFTGLPFIRLTDRGLVDMRARRFVEVVL